MRHKRFFSIHFNNLKEDEVFMPDQDAFSINQIQHSGHKVSLS